MQYSPVALFVFNRPHHTKATLDALAKNVLARETDLHIFCDGPRGENDESAVNEVASVVSNVSGFASITIKRSDANLGLANSIIAGVTEILDFSERVIVLEDDLITTSSFLSYMNKALNIYSQVDNVFSVTGYTLPETRFDIPSTYQYDTFANPRFSSWSWGTWKSRWKKVDWSMAYFSEFILDPIARRGFAKGGDDLIEMLQAQKDGKIDSWAIRFSYAHFENNSYCIYPRKTLVQNIGFDGSGVHCKPSTRFSHAQLDNNWIPTFFSPATFVDAEVSRRFRYSFERRPGKVKRVQRKIERFIRNISSILRRTP